MCDNLTNTKIQNTRLVGDGKYRKRTHVCLTCGQHIMTIEIIIPRVSVGRPDDAAKLNFKERLLDAVYGAVEGLLK